MNARFRPGSRNLIETILVLLLLLGLLLSLYQVLHIFFGVLTFALIFSVSFHGLFEKMVGKMRGRRTLVAVIYAILLVAVIALPVTYIISGISSHMREIVEWVNETRQNGLPPLPIWMVNLPYIGPDISAYWQSLRANPHTTIVGHERQVGVVVKHVVSSGAEIIGAALQLIIGIIVSAFFLVGGQTAVRPFRLAIQHLLGKKDGEELLDATIMAVKGVSIGVMGTAFITGVVSWVGFAIGGVPFALLLSALVFLVVLIQIGPLVIWIPVIIWMATQGHPGITVFLIIYGAALQIGEAILKPLLIAKSGKLPFLILFLGVIGGAAAWGFTGIFKGAIIMAVFYTIFNSWLDGKSEPQPVE
ncbi:Predicted PurR-regulated permease PerM [Chitinophaga jiangningensis]|uniref:Predicted PurR-regulated permease PerM n=1 Tax=Chitinophaga jiangningensis TaxID=1419482 RepID=A0A1M7KJ55_9BACT|nr:AI-2E family transporter [Chitinophaga jiangningensis]SHM65442.1 Predicted PurR-regulated permease PerM [Chitinophaga jiangningensis]